ncbi:hypothetical protein GGR57DRAFT_32845 [Xylariaceae sp. FL1272]|nr:hypothetical protein GGR57DRAFT_32845 [Xylariaceae sp. FL1272]
MMGYCVAGRVMRMTRWIGNIMLVHGNNGLAGHELWEAWLYLVAFLLHIRQSVLMGRNTTCLLRSCVRWGNGHLMVSPAQILGEFIKPVSHFSHFPPAHSLFTFFGLSAFTDPKVALSRERTVKRSVRPVHNMAPPFEIPSYETARHLHHQITDRIRQVIAARARHAAFDPRPRYEPRDTPGDAYSSSTNGVQSTLSGGAIAGIVVACVVGTVILAWVLYLCWTVAQPSATYYETAVKTSKNLGPCRCERGGRCAQHPVCRINRTYWSDSIEEEEDICRPPKAKRRDDDYKEIRRPW